MLSLLSPRSLFSLLASASHANPVQRISNSVANLFLRSLTDLSPSVARSFSFVGEPSNWTQSITGLSSTIPTSLSPLNPAFIAMPHRLGAVYARFHDATIRRFGTFPQTQHRYFISNHGNAKLAQFNILNTPLIRRDTTTSRKIHHSMLTSAKSDPPAVSATPSSPEKRVAFAALKINNNATHWASRTARPLKPSANPDKRQLSPTTSSPSPSPAVSAFKRWNTAPEQPTSSPLTSTSSRLYRTAAIVSQPREGPDDDSDVEEMERATQLAGPVKDRRPKKAPLGGIKADEETLEFRLDEDFVDGYASLQAPFGFDGLGEIVYRRTYSRVKPDGKNEAWHETVARVVNGTYNMQKRWIEERGLGWDTERAQRSAKKMYDKIFKFKFLPPGRGLWAMGSPLTEERGLYAALNNCAFVSTEGMWEKGRGGTPSKPFGFLMDASMLGVGVGFDCKGAIHVEASHNTYSSVVPGPDKSLPKVTFRIPDTREGWVESTTKLIDSYLVPGRAQVEINYDDVRKEGSIIKGFGGIASGPGPLITLHESVRTILEKNTGKMLSLTSIVDMMNMIGKCVVSGNVRRTAEIAFGPADSAEYMDLKNYEVNPHRMEYGWTSNNSIFCETGMDYGSACERVRLNGEPGFFWLENARNYGRMADPPDHKDARACGGNPCLEQTLESYELCCLVETFPNNHADLDEFLDTIKYAYLYAKTVTLGSTHWPETNRVLLRNRRIGCSMSGVAQFVSRLGIDSLRTWCEDGYKKVNEIDTNVSDWLAIPRSVKTTSIKPSGTVSLLAGATPGMHYPESRFCIRRIRMSKLSDLVEPLRKAGYTVEPCVGNEEASVVVEFPIDFGPGIRALHEISMWEQLALAAFLQRYWADNQVSSTITFDPETEGKHLKHALDYYQYQLKGISFLPRISYGAYPQMPYEAIEEPKYKEMVLKVNPGFLQVMLKGDNIAAEDPESEKFCDSAACEWKPGQAKA
ncbi:PFL-like glycyl radical enzyme [Gonapodya prolifera JEL478]|uniref:ribonucleoside-triphosphate reductase (thioredoxin) n=1 Tax=Gonapodya prolifera (strain JEL478) TaxID=1344416 RepID=A0A139AQ87_GONPJ|nr:PFL-like glycyl radical enzyme [Gonapodya prolifera JEL478]|eukprot:KXS18910.1 PFL-like glycyl radical enzyme [Gonapodya prolifera JEL478]